MATGLPLSNVVQVDIILSPAAAQGRDFGALLIAGGSDVIPISERIRLYTTLDVVAEDFGLSAPEYLSAALFFSQRPQPSRLYIGRYAATATKATLYGSTITDQAALLTTLQGISSGGFAITIDGTVRTLATLDFSAITTLSGAAAIIDTALSTNGDCVWNSAADRFEIRSATTGGSSTLSTVTSTPLSTALEIRTADGASIVDGMSSESPAVAAALFANISTKWYGLMFANGHTFFNSTQLAVAAFIEGASPTRIYGLTSTDDAILDANDDTDIASELSAANYRRTFVQYSSTSNYAVASFFGRAFTVNFDANQTTLTMKFKTEPGVVAESLTSAQAAACDAKHANVFVDYVNDTAIIQQGVMADGTFFDEVHGLDWLQDEVQTDVFNLLYQSTTKIPQTEAGINMIVTAIARSLGRAVANGLIAPGTWTANGLGQLKQFDYLPEGFYIYANPLATQSQADREARRAPPIQAAIKMAGAVHSANVLINVNR